jgi:quercetin dioxygenase-like cupin family protein
MTQRSVPRVERWSGAAPAEDALRDIFHAEGLQPYAWSNGPGFIYAAHEHSYDKILRVARGGIRFDLPELGEAVELGAGDTLFLPRHVLHGATVGPLGVTCLEAHQTADET